MTCNRRYDIGTVIQTRKETEDNCLESSHQWKEGNLSQAEIAQHGGGGLAKVGTEANIVKTKDIRALRNRKHLVMNQE